MARKASKSLSEAVSAEIKSKFDLNKFKSSKGLNKNVKFKDQQWIPLSPAFQKVAGVPGIPMGHISKQPQLTRLLLQSAHFLAYTPQRGSCQLHAPQLQCTNTLAKPYRSKQAG